MTTFLVTGLLGFVVALFATLVVRRLARDVGLVDKPDGVRKVHGRVVPLGGGLALLASSIAVVAFWFLAPNPFR